MKKLAIVIALLASSAAMAFDNHVVTVGSGAAEGLIGSAAISGGVTGVTASSNPGYGHESRDHGNSNTSSATAVDAGAAFGASRVTVAPGSVTSISEADHIQASSVITSGNADALAGGLSVGAAGNLGFYEIQSENLLPRHGGHGDRD